MILHIHWFLCVPAFRSDTRGGFSLNAKFLQIFLEKLCRIKINAYLCINKLKQHQVMKTKAEIKIAGFRLKAQQEQ